VRRIAIVGGGIAGLSVAYYLQQARRQATDVSYVLFEKSSRLGGVLHSERVDGCLIEAGADSFLSEKPWALELCRELGIESQLIGSNDAQRKTWVAVKGKLHPLPEGLQFIVPTSSAGVQASALFSAEGKRQIAAEREFPRPEHTENHGEQNNNDESVGAFLQRHFGREFVERVGDPLFAGIYGVGSQRLSAQAALPKFIEMERKHGSLIRAMESRNSPEMNERRPLFTSFRDGMQTLVDSVVSKLDAASIRLNQEAQSVIREGERWRISCTGSAESFDGLILALPAPIAGQLLRQDFPELAAKLQSIPYTSSMTVALGYEPSAMRSQTSPLPAGFGFLVSQTGSAKEERIEAKENMLACTFVHQKFAHRAPPGWALLRGFLGGEEKESDEAAVAAVRARLAELLGWKAEPAFTRVYRWPQAMPVCEVGHLDRVAEIQRLCQQRPRLSLIGNAYVGIGIPDGIRQGKQAAAQILTPASAILPSACDR
jgi:oxygen-dependent protoporphyrinogen oxidase